MNFFEIRDRANRVRGISLEAVLRLSGAKPDRYDQAKWHTAQGVLSVTGAKFMNWTRGIGGGGAIDLAIHLNNMEFKTAVQWLWHHFPNSCPGEQLQPRRRPGLKLPPGETENLSRVKSYLIKNRKLPKSLVQALIESGRLYADHKSNAVFLLLGKDNTPVGAEIRGTTFRPWRAMATGSQKDLGYFSTITAHPTSIILCESAIDAISCSVLHSRSLCISTAGARANPRWLEGLIREEPQVYCGFDADQTGEDMARAMITMHPTVIRMQPARKDWNDVLQAQS